MGMGLRMSLRISPALELRQALEARLTQGLFIRQSQRLALALYRKREDELTRLYRKVLERRMVKRYDKHGMAFEYALVRAEDVPDELKADGNWAFSHCLYSALEALFAGRRHAMARGSWLLFVICDLYAGMPERYLEYAAVHERGEQVTLGDHNLASKLEFAIAREEGKLIGYMGWLEENCPAKFADVFSYQAHLDLPAADEFQEVLELSTATEEATRVRQMITAFEWPSRLLQKLTSYQKRGEAVAEIVTRALHAAEVLAGEGGTPLKELIERIRGEVARRLRAIVERELTRYISYPRLDALWREQRIAVDTKFAETLMRRQLRDPAAYQAEVFAAGIRDALPPDGVLALNFREALAALR